MRASALSTRDIPSLGKGALAPPLMPGTSDVALVRSMADYLLETSPDTGAEALSLLRRMFPDSPLTVRVAALAALMRR